jgi:nickel-dependent lactate racemase
MQTNTVEVMAGLWYGEQTIELGFPDDWEVTRCRMGGEALTPLTREQMRDALNQPIGTPPLRQLGRGKKTAVILFDDLARPTPTYLLAPLVLEELRQAGIEGDSIRFVAALGNHRALARDDIVKKLGTDIVRNYNVYNHNPYENLVEVGRTSRGTPVIVNREVMGADLKIAIGSIIPHFAAGFGGGAKLLLPGVSGMDSVVHNHSLARQHADLMGLGKVNSNPMRLDVEEAAGIAGLDFIVNVVVNHRKESLGLFAGDFVQAHRQGVILAKKAYGTVAPPDMDIVVVSAYPVEVTPQKGLWAARASLHEGGDVVLILGGPLGRMPHYLMGRFGTDYGGRLWKPSRGLSVRQARRILVMGDHFSKNERDDLGPSEKVLWFREWPAVVAELSKGHGPGTRVAVYPYGSLQCPIFPEDW